MIHSLTTLSQFAADLPTYVFQFFLYSNFILYRNTLYIMPTSAYHSFSEMNTSRKGVKELTGFTGLKRSAMTLPKEHAREAPGLALFAIKDLPDVGSIHESICRSRFFYAQTLLLAPVVTQRVLQLQKQCKTYLKKGVTKFKVLNFVQRIKSCCHLFADSIQTHNSKDKLTSVWTPLGLIS